MPQATKKTVKKVPKKRIAGLVQRAHGRIKTYIAKRPHRSFRRTYRPRQQLGGSPVPSIPALISDTSRFIWREKKLFGGLALIYSVFTYVVVGGLSQLDFIALREATSDVVGGNLAVLGTMFALFGGVVDGIALSTPSELQQFLGVLVPFIFWLAIVWAARMRLADQPVKIRDALYNCCAPLISSLVVLIALLVQLLPAILALFAWALADVSGWLNGGVAVMLFSFALILAFLLSAYWVSSSLLAMVVVTIPGMYPWRALSAASELVIGQRWRLALHVAVVALLIMIVWAVVVVLALYLDGWLRIDWLPLIPILIQMIAGLTIVLMAAYVYKLYRSLL
jgi:hypothetical protein